jgi:Tfp pilus assembly protein PilO
MSKKVTHNTSRRDKITKAGSTVFIAVAVAAVIVMFSIMAARFLWEKKSYNDRVITAKTKARNDINTNLENIDKLTEQFSALDQSATTNSKVILHALPPNYDYAALLTSMEFLAQKSGVVFTGSIGTDTSASAVLESNESKPQEIPLTLSVKGSYDNIVTYVRNLEYSIRPIHLDVLNVRGSTGSLTASITARTYYQPARNLDVTRSAIQ